MSTVIKFKRSSKFESIKKISNQLLSEKEVRRIFKFKDHDVLAYKVLDNEVNEYLDFEFEDLNELDKTKNIYMRIQKLSSKTSLGEELQVPEISATSCTCTSSISQESPSLNITTLSNENIANEILRKEDSCTMDKDFKIEVFDHVVEDINKDDEQIQDKQTQNSSESYKFPLEEISHYPKLYSALKSKNLLMVNEDTLLTILYDSIKTQSFNHELIELSYENVIDSLFSHYPHLAKSYGNSKTSKNTWIVKLKKKFANDCHSSQGTRSLDDCCLPPSKIRKLNALLGTTSKAQNLSPSKTQKMKYSREMLTNFSIPLSKFEKNQKLAKALKAKKFFERGPIGWMSTIILNELKEIGEDNPRGYECAGAFVFNKFRRYFKNARKDDPKEFIKYYKRSLETKKANIKKRSFTSVILNDSTDTSEEEEAAYAMVERYGFPHYVPSKVLDPNDFKDAIEKMKVCHKLDDAAKIKDLMAFTFGIRRQMVTSRNFTPLDLITLMPALFTSKQFFEEINRIVGFKVMTKKLEEQMKQFCLDTLPDEISKINNSKFKPALVELYKGSINSNNIDRQRFKLMLGEIAILLQEDPNLIYGHETSTIMSPYILMNSDSYQSTLMINGKVILRDIRAIDMALIWCSSFPILNLEVPRRVKKTYLFLTKALLQWQPCGKGQPMSAMVSSLLNSFDRNLLEVDV